MEGGSNQAVQGAAKARAHRRFRAWFPLAYAPSYLLDGSLLALFAAAGSMRVADGRMALEAWRKQLFDVVLMDCQMPDMDGYEAARRIRLQETVTRVPIIALTAHSSAADREACLAAGMDDYLAKPFKPTELTSVLLRWTGAGENKT